MITTDNSKYENFVSSLSSIKTQRVYRSYAKLGEYDYTDCDVEMVEQAILSVNPQSISSISVACVILRGYAEFLGDTHLAQVVDSIDRNKLWERAKPNRKKKFISYGQYLSVCRDIEMWEEHNALYYQTLFMAIYEGIYNNDMSVVKNLRVSDIEGNKVILHPNNGDKYVLEVSKELIENLKELSEITTWEQTGRYGYIQLKLEGDHPDTIFKIVRRNNSTGYQDDRDREAYFYYHRLRKIAKDYIEYTLKAYDLYISGIVHRIEEKLNENDVTLQDAFKPQNRERLIGQIFSDELARSHYPNTVCNFRELIISYLDVFLE